MQITEHSKTLNGTSSPTSSLSQPPPTDPFKERFGQVNPDELVRLLLQSLHALGYQNVAETLERDSGITLESSLVTGFRAAVLDGKWAKCESLFPQLCRAGELEQATYDHVRFLIRQQKFLELLEARNLMKALSVLRKELSPLGGNNTDRLHELSSLILCSSADEVKQRIQGDHGEAAFSREQLLVQLQWYIDPSIMIPRDRLLTLINQAFEWQRSNCLYHNRVKASYSLFTDHLCDKNEFPTTTISILKDHADEVWHVTYSHSGRYLASASKDGSCIIWDMKTHLRVKRLQCTSSISYCSWSPDDSKVVLCGNDSLLLIWDPFEEEILQKFLGHSDQVTSCVWLPGGEYIVSGSLDKTLRLWKTNGNLVTQLDEQRIVDMGINANGSRLVTIGCDKKLNVYDVSGVKLTKICDIQEECEITSLTLSKDGKYALVNLQETQEIHLWDLQKQVVAHKYVGFKQGSFIIRSTFGGVDGLETFVLSGSEDNRVYVWSREHDSLLEVLEGHQQSVNSVAWCPSSSPTSTFASASDDRTIRIWGLDQNQDNTNGHCQGNGSSSQDHVLV